MSDVIVVGSGPGGANAAAALIERGCRVRMIDYGNQDTHYAPLIPELPFRELRRGDPHQHRYLLGDRYEGIPLGPVRVGAQLTPPRMYVLASARENIPVDAPGMSLSMSLGRGGLGAAWSAGIFPFTADELRDTGLAMEELQPYYAEVYDRVGVCGAQDDLAPFFPSAPSMMPPLELDAGTGRIAARYARRRHLLNRRGFFLGRARLAVCTRPFRGRGPCDYSDMEYWADFRRAVYRAQWTVDELEAKPGFTYLPRLLVERFRETEEGVAVEVRQADGGGRETLQARALVLAAGTLSTARLVLRSLACPGRAVPMLCNAYTYVPMLNTGMLWRPWRDRRSSLAQLTALLKLPEGRLVQSQVFSYRSLLTFKLMKELPLGLRDSRLLLQHLIPSLAILGIHHEDRPSPAKTCILLPADPDRLEVSYEPAAAEVLRQRADEKRLLSCFLRLGCLPLKTIRPGHGASIHYAGTFPMTPEDRPLTCDTDGRLRGTRRVYLADGSFFPWLPPKGLTFNIMAHASRVGALLAGRLR